jgi:hypothetical protein
MMNGGGRSQAKLETVCAASRDRLSTERETVIPTGHGRGYNLGVFGSIFGQNVTQNLPVLGIRSDQPANNYDAVFTSPAAHGTWTLPAFSRRNPKGRTLVACFRTELRLS